MKGAKTGFKSGIYLLLARVVHQLYIMYLKSLILREIEICISSSLTKELICVLERKCNGPTFHMANLGSISGIPYSPLSTALKWSSSAVPGVSLEHCFRVWPKVSLSKKRIKIVNSDSDLKFLFFLIKMYDNNELFSDLWKILWNIVQWNIYLIVVAYIVSVVCAMW